MRHLLPLVLALFVAVQPDAARVLADMRQALGGDTALAAVQAFSATGSQTTNLEGHTAGADIEWICALPDRFIRTRRLGTPYGGFQRRRPHSPPRLRPARAARSG